MTARWSDPGQAAETDRTIDARAILTLDLTNDVASETLENVAPDRDFGRGYHWAGTIAITTASVTITGDAEVRLERRPPSVVEPDAGRPLDDGSPMPVAAIERGRRDRQARVLARAHAPGNLERHRLPGTVNRAAGAA